MLLISVQLLLLSHYPHDRVRRHTTTLFGDTHPPSSGDTRFPNPFHGTKSYNVGVTCLLPLLSNLEQQEQGVLVGNKRGTLQFFQPHHGNHPSEPLLIQKAEATFWEKDQTNGETLRRPSPVFSLDAKPDGALVFSGAGDRYVSVWEKEQEPDNNNNGDWNCIEKLGPHTGWVRSILYNAATGRLHSIGCNCIETWCQDDSGGQWQHVKKSTIESSPEQGSTLSSDLLCLCPLGDDSSYFVAGGVDGRLHVWDSHLMGKPLFSAPAAHDGRVNAMEFSAKSNLLFTAGNDGKVKCWKCYVADQRIDLMGEFVIVGNEQESSRVTCLWTQDFGGSHDYIFCGTNVGEVLLLKNLPNGSPPLTLVTTFQLLQRPIVHCLCMFRENHQQEPDLWVGHSNGLSVFPLNNFASLKSLSS